MEHAKKMVIITTPHGKPSTWVQWAEHNGYEIEYKQLSELTIEGHEGHVIVIDSLGLYDAPLPNLLGTSLVEEFLKDADAVTRGREIHERLAALPKHLHIYDEVIDPFAEYLFEQCIKIRDCVPKLDGVVLKPTPRKKGPPKRLGHRKGNKADRWR